MLREALKRLIQFVALQAAFSSCYCRKRQRCMLFIAFTIISIMLRSPHLQHKHPPVSVTKTLNPKPSRQRHKNTLLSAYQCNIT
jgi:hypothetical protein